jgi:hypothetical protein
METNTTIQCDQCEALMINGRFCHETGCHNSRKTWVSEREEWVRFVECRECGCDVEEGTASNPRSASFSTFHALNGDKPSARVSIEEWHLIASPRLSSAR